MHLLTLITFIPLVGALAVMLLPERAAAAAKWVTAVFMTVDLALTVAVLLGFNQHNPGMQFAEKAPWIPSLGITYHLGVDGISITMLALSALLSLIAVIGSWKITDRARSWFVMLLLLEVGMNGVFVALDFVLFYVFWELVLIPMYFIIAWWGGARRSYASLKFFIYTLFGSVLMLVGILALYLNPAGHTFDLVELANKGFDPQFQWWVFAAFFVGFAIKVPMWPLHTWLPDAHVEAPTAGSVILAGVLLKMGTYGFLRISLPILPEASHAWAPTIALLAVVSIIYGAAVALVQPDLKKLVAYSSVAHMGFVMLGIASGTPEGIDGAIAIMVAHGLITGLLFLLVGMVYDRTHTRQIVDLAGVSEQMPVLGGMLAFASYASLGLPGLAGFIGEFLVLLGTWKSGLGLIYVLGAGFGMLLAATYMLWMVYRVVFGHASDKIKGQADASPRELLAAAPLMVLSAVLGVWWAGILNYADPAVRALIRSIGGAS